MTDTADQEPATQEIVLTPKLSPHWALALWHLFVVAAWCGFFLLLNYLPLQAADLWSHVVTGNWIVEHRSLPAEDPLMPLAEGMQLVDTAWLTQVLLALVEAPGAQWLSNLWAVTVVLTYLLLARTYYLQSGRMPVALVSTLAVLILSCTRFTTLHPEFFAVFCFACLLWLFAKTHDSAAEQRNGALPATPGWLWLGLPLLLALWANLHSSFIWGAVVPWCYLLGCVIEVAWRNRSLRAIWFDPSVRRWLYLSELSLAATLLNPYGFDLLLHVVWSADRRNLQDLMDWQQLNLLALGGREFALSFVVLLIVLRHSRQRFPVAHGLLLAVFAVAALARQRMLIWYAPVFGLVITPHLTELWSRYRARVPSASQMTPLGSTKTRQLGGFLCRQSWTYSLVGCLLLWITFSLSGLSQPILGGKLRTPKQLFGSATPLELTQYLQANPSPGVVFNPHWWGDWLAWQKPPGLQPFLTSQVQSAPRQVWQDYGRVSSTQAGWQGVLDKYRIDRVIVDKGRQRTFAQSIRSEQDWLLRYEDEQALVFDRRRPQDTPATPDAAAANTESAEDEGSCQ